MIQPVKGLQIDLTWGTMHLQITSSRVATERKNIFGGMNMVSSSVSTGSRTFRKIAFLAAALVTGSATSAFASTMLLTGGDPGEGLTLNSADVLVATTAIAGTSETVQSVTFTVPTGSTPTATNTANGVTVTISAPNTLSGSFTYPGDESMPPTNPSTPNDNALKALMDNISFNYGGTKPPMIISVSGLAHNTQYTIDLLESSIGYGARTQYVSFSDSTPTETVNLGNSDEL
jgi:hypothetical protein